MSQMFQLYRLQQIDSQLDEAQERVLDIDRLLGDDTALNLAKTNAISAESILKDAISAQRRAEQNVGTQVIKIEQTGATLYSGKVRNPKELQDLENETAALKRYLEVLEERQLEAMFAEEDARKINQERSIELALVTAKSAREHKDLEEEKASLQRDISRLENERKATTNSIPDGDLTIYEQLRVQRRGIAVALVKDNFCAACGTTLSAALLYEARSPNKLTRCDTCGRFLYAG